MNRGIAIASGQRDLERRELMKRGKKIATEEVTYSLGDLVAALFDETRKISSDQLEQNILVYAALKDLLRRRIRTDHQIALIA